MTISEELILDNARNRFEEKGIQIQFGSRNMNKAIENYENSCLRCTMFHSCTGKECSIQKAFLHNTKKYDRELRYNPALRQRVIEALALD